MSLLFYKVQQCFTMLIFEFMLNGKIIFWVLLFGFATMQSFGQVKVLQGKVVKVIDGDTFDLLTNEDVLFRVRMAHIDAPEKKQDFDECRPRIPDGFQHFGNNNRKQPE